MHIALNVNSFYQFLKASVFLEASAYLDALIQILINL